MELNFVIFETSNEVSVIITLIISVIKDFYILFYQVIDLNF